MADILDKLMEEASAKSTSVAALKRETEVDLSLDNRRVMAEIYSPIHVYTSFRSHKDESPKAPMDMLEDVYRKMKTVKDDPSTYGLNDDDIEKLDKFILDNCSGVSGDEQKRLHHTMSRVDGRADAMLRFRDDFKENGKMYAAELDMLMCKLPDGPFDRDRDAFRALKGIASDDIRWYSDKSTKPATLSVAGAAAYAHYYAQTSDEARKLVDSVLSPETKTFVENTMNAWELGKNAAKNMETRLETAVHRLSQEQSALKDVKVRSPWADIAKKANEALQNDNSVAKENGPDYDD